MSDLIARLESATEPSRELSDECLLAIGWRDAGKHLGQWIRPDGSRCYKSDAPHVTANAQDAIDHMVPEGWRVDDLMQSLDGTWWDANLTNMPERGDPGRFAETESGMATPGLALSAASLRAHEAIKARESEEADG